MSTTQVPDHYLSVPASCKFCRIPLTLRVDPAGANTPMFDMSIMVKFAACNRCADFYEKIRSVGESIFKAACEFLTKKKPEREKQNREKLENLTKGYARIVCDHYHQPRDWQQDFADQIIENPDKVGLILKLYRKGVSVRGRAQASLPYADQ